MEFVDLSVTHNRDYLNYNCWPSSKHDRFVRSYAIADHSDTANRLWWRYGNEAHKILAMIDESPTLVEEAIADTGVQDEKVLLEVATTLFAEQGHEQLQVYLKELRKDACLGVFIGYLGYCARVISINTASNTVNNK